MPQYRSRFFRRIVTPYFILLLIVMSAAMIFVYRTVTDRITTNAIENGRQLAQKTAQQTDSYLNDMDLIAQQLCRQTDIVNYFYNLQTEADSTNKFDKDVLKSIELSSSLKRVLVDRIADYNITIYNNYGDFISSREYAVNQKELPELLSSVNYDETVAQIAANGGTLILPPEKNKWTNERAMFITLMRALKNEYSDNVCGIIEVRCNISLLSNTIGADITDGTGVLIIDNDSENVIFPVTYGESFSEQNGYVTANVEKADWTIALHVREAQTGGFSGRLIIIFIVVYLLMAAFIFVITDFLGRYITRPISELTQYVKSIDTLDTELNIVNDEAIDEVKELEDSFAKMLSRMNKSILQEKKAYSLALQAQMNPHFLYNSLSVIGAAGNEAGAEAVYDMCIELSDMLRYVAAYEKVTVPLKEEIQHTRNYLSLMKSRYEDYFTYTLTVSDELLNMAVPKLIIQPLAENCFMHGFKGKEPPWNIDIQLHGNPKKWELVIKDNGTGISEENIEKIQKQLESAENEMTVGNIGGLGVVNTITRLKMTHSKRINYKIWNDSGMVIKITAEDE